jgi:hypothetical protein
MAGLPARLLVIQAAGEEPADSPVRPDGRTGSDLRRWPRGPGEKDQEPATAPRSLVRGC